jgi:cytochrome c oxidase subunit 2
VNVHRLERRWLAISIALVAVMGLLVVYTAVAMKIRPPSNVETIDSTRLHLTKEFAEDHIGVERGPDGTVVARIVMARYMVHPQEITLPAGTNIAAQIVPGYVSEVHTVIHFDSVARIGTPNPDGSVTVPLFCNEYCGLGHQSMWGRVRVTRP